MTLPAPLPIPQEELIIVELVAGMADTSLVHLPAQRSMVEGRGGSRFDSLEFPPATWPPACRRIPSGSVYARAGMLASAPICPDCSAVFA